MKYIELVRLVNIIVCPEAEKVAKEVLSLSVYPELTINQLSLL